MKKQSWVGERNVHYKKDFLYISSMSLMNLMKLFFLIHLLSVLGR